MRVSPRRPGPPDADAVPASVAIAVDSAGVASARLGLALDDVDATAVPADPPPADEAPLDVMPVPGIDTAEIAVDVTAGGADAETVDTVDAGMGVGVPPAPPIGKGVTCTCPAIRTAWASAEMSSGAPGAASAVVAASLLARGACGSPSSACPPAVAAVGLPSPVPASNVPKSCRPEAAPVATVALLARARGTGQGRECRGQGGHHGVPPRIASAVARALSPFAMRSVAAASDAAAVRVGAAGSSAETGAAASIEDDTARAAERSG